MRVLGAKPVRSAPEFAHLWHRTARCSLGSESQALTVCMADDIAALALGVDRQATLELSLPLPYLQAGTVGPVGPPLTRRKDRCP
jgi:hypothetical protein